MTHFVNPWHPSRDEILAWAFDAGALWPDQDFDLSLSWRPGLDQTYVELAANESCPHRRFFLRVLYLMVGDAVRTDFLVADAPRVDALIALGDTVDHPDIRTWQERSRHLLQHPADFDYAKWCDGGLAREGAG